MPLFFNNKGPNVNGFTGRNSCSAFAGNFISFSLGRLGLFSKLPPQFGQTFCNTFSTHSLQKVHSKVHIIASVLWLGNFFPQFSQIGLSSSIYYSFSIIASSRLMLISNTRFYGAINIFIVNQLLVSGQNFNK